MPPQRTPLKMALTRRDLQTGRVIVQFSFRKGLVLDMGAAPKGDLIAPLSVGTVGFLGQDYPGVTFDLRVAEGDLVRMGQTLCVDRHRPDIRFVAPATGRISRITLGARRRLEALEIAVEGDAEHHLDPAHAQGDDAGLRQLLLESGAWPGFRTRPFGHVPDPGHRPASIFVTATDTNPLAADPVAVLAPQMALFQRGAEALLRLTDGPIFICQQPGPPLAEAQGRLRLAHFAGPHPSGQAGSHIHRLMPVSRQRSVWQIGYQEVVAIGHLLETGRIMGTRVLSLAGSGLIGPALVKAPLGACLADLVKNQTQDPAPVLLSGPILSGHATAYLRRHDLQVTAVASTARSYPARPFWHRLMDVLPAAPIGATLPLEAFERAFPFDLLPAPLMRALAVGDVETAERLGCLELLEEDLAPLSWLCPSGSDYGALLRRALNRLAEERVE
jgi:Na+-transporting NADH:ubiquinone oxidoreductase subunit A